MMVVSVAAVSAVTVRCSAFGGTGSRRPFLMNARTMRGSKSVPPLATELTAAAIWRGVTLIWYPIDTDARPLSFSRDAFQTMPALSPLEVRRELVSEAEPVDVAAEPFRANPETRLDRADVAGFHNDVFEREHAVRVDVADRLRPGKVMNPGAQSIRSLV